MLSNDFQRFQGKTFLIFFYPIKFVLQWISNQHKTNYLLGKHFVQCSVRSVEMFKGKGQRIIQSDDNNSHDPLF